MLNTPSKCSLCQEKIPSGDSKLIVTELARYKPWEVKGFQNKLETLFKGKLRQLRSAICYKCFCKEILGKEV